MDKIIVNTMKDYENYTYNTPRPYNNRAVCGGETKDVTLVDKSNKIEQVLNGRVTLIIKNKNGGEIVDINKKLEVNITRKYNWNSRNY